MPFNLGSLIPAAATAIGYYFGGPMGGTIGASLGSGFASMNATEAQRDTNEQNIALGREQMQFQREMSNTSWQRGVADMKAAGLNPMLAYSQGGATAPAGAMPQIQNPVGAGMSSGLQASQTMQGLQAIAQSRAQTQLLLDEAAKTRSETIDNSLHTALTAAEIRAATQRAWASETEGGRNYERMQEDVTSARQREQQYKAELVGTLKGDDAFTADVNRRKAEARLKMLDIPQAEGSAKFWRDTGSLSPYIRGLLEILRGFRK